MAASVDWDAIHANVEAINEYVEDNASDFIEPETVQMPPEDYDRADASMLQEKKRPRGALTYEKKIKGVLTPLTVAALKHEATQADGAALLMFGPKLTSAAADVAATNPQAAKIVDWLTEGTDNHALALVMVAAPLILQIVRNHEPSFEPAPRGVKIPFTKRRIKIPWKIGIRLGGLRNMTAEPTALITHALSEQSVRDALKKQGVVFAPGL